MTVVGNLADDPELRFTPSGAAVCAFRMASTPRKRDGDNWVDEDPTWYRVAAWRQLAENVAESLSKGDRVIVYGKLINRAYRIDGEDKDRTSLEVTAEYVGAEMTFREVKIQPKQGGTNAKAGRRDDPLAGTSTERPASSTPTASGGTKISTTGQAAESPASDW